MLTGNEGSSEPEGAAGHSAGADAGRTKRSRRWGEDMEPSEPEVAAEQGAPDDQQQKKRRSRWAADEPSTALVAATKQVALPGLPLSPSFSLPPTIVQLVDESMELQRRLNLVNQKLQVQLLQAGQPPLDEVDDVVTAATGTGGGGAATTVIGSPREHDGGRRREDDADRSRRDSQQQQQQQQQPHDARTFSPRYGADHRPSRNGRMSTSYDRRDISASSSGRFGMRDHHSDDRDYRRDSRSSDRDGGRRHEKDVDRGRINSQQQQQRQQQQRIRTPHRPDHRQQRNEDSGSGSRRSSGAEQHQHQQHYGPQQKGYDFHASPLNKEINQKLSTLGARSANSVVQFFRRWKHDYDASNVASTLYQLGSCAGQAASASGRDRHAMRQEIQSALLSPEFEELKRAAELKLPSFSARNLSNAFWAFAKLDHHPGPLLVNMCKASVLKNLANTCWALGVLGHDPGRPLLDALSASVCRQLDDMIPQNISNTVIAFAKLDYRPPGDLLDEMAVAAAAKIRDFIPQALSNTAWAYAKLIGGGGGGSSSSPADGVGAGGGGGGGSGSGSVSQPVKRLMELILEESKRKLEQYNPQNVGNTVWALATLGIPPDTRFLDAVASLTIARLHEFQAQNVANVAWGFAKLGYCHEGLLAAVEAFVLERLQELPSQSISNVMYAYALLQYSPSATFLRRVGDHAARELLHFAPQHVSNVLWAFATLGCRHDGLFDAAADKLPHLLADPEQRPTWNCQNVTNTCWAFGAVEHGGVATEALLRVCMAVVVPEKLTGFTPQELANMVWASAKLSVYDESFMDLVADTAAADLSAYTHQHLANLAWAYSKLTHVHRPLMRAIAVDALSGSKGLAAFTNQHVSNLVSAFAVFSFLQDEMREVSVFLDELMKLVRRRVLATATPTPPKQLVASAAAGGGGGGGGTPPPQLLQVTQHISNIAWGAAILGRCPPDLWNALMYLLEERGEGDIASTPEEFATQLFHAHLVASTPAAAASIAADAAAAAHAATSQHPGSTSTAAGNYTAAGGPTYSALPFRPAPHGLHERGRQRWLDYAAAAARHVSAFHRDVSAILSTLGVDHVNEHPTADGCFSIDVAVPALRVALEANGPAHFSANTYEHLGSFYARRTALEARGWRHAEIAYMDFLNRPEHVKLAVVRSTARVAGLLPPCCTAGTEEQDDARALEIAGIKLAALDAADHR